MIDPTSNDEQSIRQLNQVRALLQSKKIPQAETVLHEILKKEHKNAEALDLMAKILYLRDDKLSAKKLWKKALREAKEPYAYFSALQAFLHVLHLENNQDGIKKYAMKKLPDWPASAKPDQQQKNMLIDIANLLAKSGQLRSARNLLEQINSSLPNDVEIMASIGIMQMLERQYQDALQTFTAVDNEIQPRSDLSLLARIYQAAACLGKKELMLTIAQRATDEHPFHNTPIQPGQKHSILILYGHPDLSNTIQADEQGSQFRGNYPGQLRERLADEFHFSSIFTATEISRNAAKKLPKPELIINNLTNAEALAGHHDLQLLCDFIDGFEVPVINHPRIALSTSREQTVKLIKDIPNVITPKTIRLSKSSKTDADLIQEIESQMNFPFIIRTLSAQEGKGMVVVQNRSELAHELNNKPSEFYITEFISNQHPDGLFHKIRAAIVGDDIHIIRVDHSKSWNVHGRYKNKPEKAPLYQAYPELIEEEQRICANPEKELGSTVVRTLEMIAEKIPLDIFGVDFDVTDDGRILFFEANATMLLLNMPGLLIDYPSHAELGLIQSIRRYFDKKCRSSR